MPGERIRLCRLFERTSAKGTVYRTGRLGYGTLLAFPGEPVESGPTWDVYLVPGREQQPARPNGRQPPARDAQGSAPSSGGTGHAPMSQRSPQGTGAARRPAAVGDDDDGVPFDDPLPFG